ncbi:MAG: RAMP superfamily CRISPR-associated protein, partial [Candidatus Desantisbacteria bacterium]
MDYKAERKIIKGKLIFDSGLHIGSGDAGDWGDSTIIKTKEGKPFIPGTTIAGMFRQLAEDNFPEQEVEALFGYVKKIDESTQSLASRLIFCDAFSSNEISPGYRNGVGIRRDRLTARDKALFSLETVEKPIFDFKLIIDNPQDDDMKMLEPILAEFQSGRVAIGGDKSRGLGWLKLSCLESAEVTTENLDDFVSYLLDEKITFQGLEINKVKTDGTGSYIEIEYVLTLEDEDASLIVSSGIPGDADQTLMRDKDKDEGGKFFIPGSS